MATALEQQLSIRTQVAAAATGYPALYSPTEASGWRQFEQAPTDIGGAYRHVAYFEAVAARLLGDSTLASQAAWDAAAATPYVAASITTSGMPEKMREAATAIEDALRRVGPGKPTAQKWSGANIVLMRAKTQSQPTQIALAQETDSGPLATIRRIQKAFDDLGETLKQIAKVAAMGLTISVVAIMAGAGWYLSRKRK